MRAPMGERFEKELVCKEKAPKGDKRPFTRLLRNVLEPPILFLTSTGAFFNNLILSMGPRASVSQMDGSENIDRRPVVV